MRLAVFLRSLFIPTSPVVLGDDWALGYPCVCFSQYVCVCVIAPLCFTHICTSRQSVPLNLRTRRPQMTAFVSLVLFSCLFFFSILKLEQNFQNVNKPTGGVSHTLPCSRQFFFRLPVLVNNTHWFSELISVISDIHHFATRCRKPLK